MKRLLDRLVWGPLINRTLSWLPKKSTTHWLLVNFCGSRLWWNFRFVLGTLIHREWSCPHVFWNLLFPSWLEWTTTQAKSDRILWNQKMCRDSACNTTCFLQKLQLSEDKSACSLTDLSYEEVLPSKWQRYSYLLEDYVDIFSARPGCRLWNFSFQPWKQPRRRFWLGTKESFLLFRLETSFRSFDSYILWLWTMPSPANMATCKSL